MIDAVCFIDSKKDSQESEFHPVEVLQTELDGDLVGHGARAEQHGSEDEECVLHGVQSFLETKNIAAGQASESQCRHRRGEVSSCRSVCAETDMLHRNISQTYYMLVNM